MKKIFKRVGIGLLITFGILVIILGFLIVKNLGLFAEGNGEAYSIDKLTKLEDSPLKDKKVLFLGSSVTDGMEAKRTSFVEALEIRTGLIPIKEAVSGTTLADVSDKSYISRLLNNVGEQEIDLFVCQLSTNDATKGIELGAIKNSNGSNYKTETVTGALEFIFDHVEETYGCPTIVYTNPYFDNIEYSQMVDRLYELQEKWDIIIIDLFSDDSFNQLSESDRKLYMNDDIHPTRAGYIEWWTPVFERVLTETIMNQ